MSVASISSTGTPKRHFYASTLPSSSPSTSTRTLASLSLKPKIPSFASLHCSSSTFILPFAVSKSRNSLRKCRFSNRPLIRMSTEAGVGVMGTKLGMMTYFEPNGTVVPVTVIGFREGNIVTQVKTDATDGYNAVQVGYRRVRNRKLTKPELGHLQKSDIIPLRHLQEFRLQSVEGFEPTQQLTFDELFKEGDLVDVSGTTIGKGFQGHSQIIDGNSIKSNSLNEAVLFPIFYAQPSKFWDENSPDLFADICSRFKDLAQNSDLFTDLLFAPGKSSPTFRSGPLHLFKRILFAS